MAQLASITYDKKAYTYYVPERDAASSEWVRKVSAT